MSTTSETRTLTDLLADYNQARRALTEFELERAPIFEQQKLLTFDVDESKQLLAEALAAASIDMVEDDDFEVGLVRQDRGYFDVTALPVIQEVYSETTLEISRAAVERLLRRGVLSGAQAAAAWVSKPVTPYLRVRMKRGEGA